MYVCITSKIKKKKKKFLNTNFSFKKKFKLETPKINTSF